jgi:hypothetical protein
MKLGVRPESHRMLGKKSFSRYPSLRKHGIGTVVLVETTLLGKV